MSVRSVTYTAEQLLELISSGVVDSYRGAITETKFKSVVNVILDEAVIDPTSTERYLLSNGDYLKVYSDIDAGYAWGKCQDNHRNIVYSVILEINGQKFRTVRGFLGDPSDPVLEEVTQHVYLDNIYKILYSFHEDHEDHPSEEAIFKLLKRTLYVTYSPSSLAHSHAKKKRRLFQWSLYSRNSLKDLLKDTDDVTFHLFNRKTIKAYTVLARSSEYYSIYPARVLSYEDSQFLVNDKSFPISLRNIHLIQTTEEHIQYLPYPETMCADRAADLDQHYGRT